jgi:general secretion pathway protein G
MRTQVRVGKTVFVILDGISNTRIIRKIRRCRAVRDRNHGGDKLDKRKNRAGFTLLEVMVVVVIIGLLATIVAPQLIGHHDDARVTKAVVDVSQIYDAAVMFKMKKGRWPDSIEEMIDGRPPSLRGYKTVPRDPWDNIYRAKAGETPLEWEVFSYGPDGEEGGDDDISSNNVQGS